MDSRKHIYYLTVSDVQVVANDVLGRKLDPEELSRVVSRVPERIEWRDPIERTILSETTNKSLRNLPGRLH
jgi:hypothetical protein